MEGLNGSRGPNTGTWTSGATAQRRERQRRRRSRYFNNSCAAKTVGEPRQSHGHVPLSRQTKLLLRCRSRLLRKHTRTCARFRQRDGIQNVKTFFIDTQEYSSNPLDGPKNMLWLAGKYGGFKNEMTEECHQAGEWDEDNDGIPDNYVLATRPQNLVKGLDRAFDFIDDSCSSASSAAINSGSISDRSRLYQTRFNGGDWTGQVLAFPINADGTLGDGNEACRRRHERTRRW